MSQQPLSSFPGQRVRLQPLLESNGQPIKPRPLTDKEKQRLERNRANRAKSAIEDRQYQTWVQRNSNTYRQITGEFPPIPPIPYRTLRRDLASVETMAGLPAVIPSRDHEDERSTTDKFNLKMIPITVFIDYRIEKDGRRPRSISMGYNDMLRLLQENALIQGCYRGHIPITPDPLLPEGEIIINY